jgi:hypothetical protein
MAGLGGVGAAAKMGHGKKNKNMKKGVDDAQSLEVSFGRLGLPVQEIHAAYVKIPGQAIDKLKPEEVENAVNPLVDAFGNSFTPSGDRYARLDRPPKVCPRLLAEVDDILLLVPSALRFAPVAELGERLEAEVNVLLNQPVPKDSSGKQPNMKDRDKDLARMENCFRERIKPKVNISAWGQIDLFDVMEATTKILTGQQEAQSANGFEIEVEIPVGRLEFRAEEERKLLDKEAVRITQAHCQAQCVR